MDIIEPGLLPGPAMFLTTLDNMQVLRYRGSYMSAHVLLNLLNELGKRNKMRGLPSIYLFFATSLINSLIQEHEC